MTHPKRRRRGKPVGKKVSPAVRQTTILAPSRKFDEVVALIEAARWRAGRAVNVQLIDLYWKIGEVICQRIERDGWGRGTVEELSAHLSRTQRGTRGFSPQNLWRMRQFYETYRDAPDLSTLLRELPWSANLHILSGAKTPEAREFYLRMATGRHWNVRELARQIGASAFERSVLGRPKLSTSLREMHPQAASDFKDVYSLEFADLADGHSEADLHGALLRNLGRFITELGRDFCFVGSEYPVQVGNQDFAIDLVFFHRGLCCLVAFELKVREFRPEDLGKLSFYLEALDRDVRKPHERPSIGVLLCATKNNEVVEYALARTTSPALVAEYQTVLPAKAILRRKLHELYAQLGPMDEEPEGHPPGRVPTRNNRRSQD
jgi:predicted nuclease of restriction endonuclease-like (RecB) superfamily